ncbi:hypothetical protein ACUXVY_18815 [Chromobacterium haemolyticum]|uniref:hypothetical protein n=1 Tax=Chromobacterium haemolyticum TaxID=394935 RepID=UPI0040562C00
MITKEQLATEATSGRAFAVVNDLVHDPDRHFEELQQLALTMASHIDAQAARIAELEQDLVGAFVRIGELEYEVAESSEAPPIIGAADLVAENRYWARHGPNMKWALIDVSDVEGIEYGMKNWQFVGPVIPPAA